MSDNNEGPNPYEIRNHEDNGINTRDDVLAVAGLLGQVTGSLGEIDKQQVGSDSQFIRAQKMDPKQALSNIVHNGSVPQAPAPVAPPMPVAAPPPVPTPTSVAPSVPPVQQVTSNPDLTKRVDELEKIIETYKKITKFKRGISYTINTTNIKGEFKSPEDILDVISSEMAKQAKTITLKLNDTNKTKR